MKGLESIRIIRLGSALIYFLATSLVAFVAGVLAPIFVDTRLNLFETPIAGVLLLLGCFLLCIASYYGYRIGVWVQSFEQREAEMRSYLIQIYKEKHYGQNPSGIELTDINREAHDDLLKRPQESWNKEIPTTYKRALTCFIVGIILMLLKVLIFTYFI